MFPMSVKNHLQPGEEILYEARPSLVPLAPPLALAVVCAAVALIAWRQLAPTPEGGGHWAAVLLGAAAAAALIWALARYVRLRANRYVLTDRRILRLTGLFSRSSMDSYLDKVNNVEHHQTFVGRLLGYGDVEIDTASGNGAEVFRRISNPLGWKRAMDAAVAAYHNASAGRGAAGAAAAAPSGADKIRDLKRLLDEGLISEAEFNAKRQQLLNQI
jgi:uncharacterized membrane protein YdbT with pleckstrin-like domain